MIGLIFLSSLLKRSSKVFFFLCIICFFFKTRNLKYLFFFRRDFIRRSCNLILAEIVTITVSGVIIVHLKCLIMLFDSFINIISVMIQMLRIGSLFYWDFFFFQKFILVSLGALFCWKLFLMNYVLKYDLSYMTNFNSNFVVLFLKIHYCNVNEIKCQNYR